MTEPTPSIENEAAAREVSLRARGLADAFRNAHGSMPDGVWGAPGRVNLIGEHTDYNDGLALPMGIQERALVAVRRRSDTKLHLVSRQAGGTTLELSEARPGGIQGWAAYVAGSIWAAVDDGARATGLDLLLDSDVPMGAGLSSSAAVECSTLLAISDLWGHERSRLDLARLAQRAEVEVAGVPCGLMDQLTSMSARSGHALSVDFRSFEVEPVPLPLERAGLALLVIDTRSPHELSEGHYAERRRSCQDAARALGVASLRDASLESLSRIAASHPLELRRARHVISENARVTASLAILRAAQSSGQATQLESLGPILSGGHASLRDDFEVTVPRLDVAAEVAERAGALGARMVGGGFGGSVIALVRSGAHERVAVAVSAAYAAHGWEAPRCFQALPGNGADRLL
jgi:galactokinase